MDLRVFRVVLRMRIKPGLERDFEAVWLDVGGSVTTHPANIEQWLARDHQDEGIYYVTSDWVSERQFREFETSTRHREHRQRLEPFRTATSLSTMHIAAHLPGAASVASHHEWEATR